MKRIINSSPLIVEDYPETYKGYPFITLIQYNKYDYLTIVDNSTEYVVSCYVLDLCAVEKLDEKFLVDIANDWFYASSSKYPISIEFSKKGLTEFTSKILKSYNTEFITRIIGPLPKFPLTSTNKPKRKRRKDIPFGIEIEYIPYLDEMLDD